MLLQGVCAVLACLLEGAEDEVLRQQNLCATVSFISRSRPGTGVYRLRCSLWTAIGTKLELKPRRASCIKSYIKTTKCRRHTPSMEQYDARASRATAEHPEYTKLYPKQRSVEDKRPA